MSAANFNAPGGSMGADQLSPEQAEAEAMKMFEALNAPEGSLGPHEPSPESMQAEAMKVLSPLIYGHMAAMSLRAAVILGIPDIINRAGPGKTMSLQEIASQLCSESPDLYALRRLMRALVHFGVFSATDNKNCELGPGGSSEETCCGKLEDSHGVQYGLTAASKLLVRANNTFAGSIPSSVLFLNHPTSQKPWEHIHKSILCGEVANEVAHGKIYEGATNSNYIHDDPKYAKLVFAYYGPRNAKVNEALKNYKGFDDEGVKTLVDAGGGKGAALASIVAAHPHIRGINYDLPDVIAQAPQIPGVEHVGGNVLESIPAGDAIFMKNLMHHFDDEQCIKILENCRQALPADGGGKLVIFDPVQMRSEFGGSCERLGFSYEQDLSMLIQRVRSEEQWRRLLGDGGFPKVQFVSFLPRHLLIEASY